MGRKTLTDQIKAKSFDTCRYWEPAVADLGSSFVPVREVILPSPGPAMVPVCHRRCLCVRASRPSLRDSPKYSYIYSPVFTNKTAAACLPHQALPSGKPPIHYRKLLMEKHCALQRPQTGCRRAVPNKSFTRISTCTHFLVQSSGKPLPQDCLALGGEISLVPLNDWDKVTPAGSLLRKLRRRPPHRSLLLGCCCRSHGGAPCRAGGSPRVPARCRHHGDGGSSVDGDDGIVRRSTGLRSHSRNAASCRRRTGDGSRSRCDGSRCRCQGSCCACNCSRDRSGC